MNHSRLIRPPRACRSKIQPRIARFAVLAAAIALAPQAAHALQGGEDPDTLPVLIGKKYGQSGELELWVSGSFPLVSKFTETTGVVGGGAYRFSRLFALGVTGGFFDGGEVGVIEALRARSGSLELTDLHRMQWFAGADAVFTPIYGRLSLASEYNPAFDLFLFVGGGVVGTDRVVGPAEPQDSSMVTAYGNAGFGFRFFILEWLGLRAEYRLFLYPEGSEDPTPNELPDIGGITAAQQLNLGLDFTFDL